MVNVNACGLERRVKKLHNVQDLIDFVFIRDGAPRDERNELFHWVIVKLLELVSKRDVLVLVGRANLSAASLDVAFLKGHRYHFSCK